MTARVASDGRSSPSWSTRPPPPCCCCWSTCCCCWSSGACCCCWSSSICCSSMAAFSSSFFSSPSPSSSSLSAAPLASAEPAALAGWASLAGAAADAAAWWGGAAASPRYSRISRSVPSVRRGAVNSLPVSMTFCFRYWRTRPRSSVKCDTLGSGSHVGGYGLPLESLPSHCTRNSYTPSSLSYLHFSSRSTAYSPLSASDSSSSSSTSSSSSLTYLTYFFGRLTRPPSAGSPLLAPRFLIPRVTGQW
mmetsp:Transcript_26513/g.75996  ORF Transcript_26513/g.75996 Transcript_26513/m.75996 type:complete len:248 (-) Transcript_26513:26-769(-)